VRTSAAVTWLVAFVGSAIAGLRGWTRAEKTSAAVIWGIAFVGGAILAAGVYRWNLAGQMDPASYLDLARALTRGHLLTGLSAYWSPLYSILLALPMAIGIDPLLAAHLVNLVIVVAILLALRVLSRRLFPALVATAPYWILEAALAYALVTMSSDSLGWPDLLLALGVLIVANRMIAFAAAPTRTRAIVLGLAGAALFWAKSPGIVLFPLLGAAFAILERRRFGALARRYGEVVGAWAVGVIPLIALFTAQHGKLTVSTSGPYTLQYLRPGALVNFLNYTGHFPPSEADYTSAWTDPSAYTTDWSPFESKGAFALALSKVFGPNFGNVVREISGFGIAVVIGLAVLAGVLVVWASRARANARAGEFGDLGTVGTVGTAGPADPLAILAAAGLTGVAGLLAIQLPTFQMARYAWLAVPVGFLGILVLADVLAVRRAGLWAAIAAAFTAIVTVTTFQFPTMPEDFQARANQIQGVGKALPAHSKVVGDDEWIAMYGAFYADAQFYGIVDVGTDETRLAQLRADGVDYLVLSEPSPEQAAWQFSQLIDAAYEPVDESIGLFRLRPAAEAGAVAGAEGAPPLPPDAGGE
jgi:hypothetical protein